MSLIQPAKQTVSATPSSRVRCSSMARSSPSPAMSSRSWGQVSWALAKPRMRVETSFTGLRRAAMPTTTESPSAWSPTERK